MRKMLIAVCALLFLPSCSAEARKEVVVSEIFNICMLAPEGAKITREIPVDVERTTYEDVGKTLSLVFSHYPGDRSKDNVKSRYEVGGPLHIRVLNEVSEKNAAIVAVVEFDSIPGGVLSRAYGRIAYTMRSDSDMGMRKLLSSWYRCRKPESR